MRSTTARQTIRLFSITAFLAVVGLASAQAKSDFSGKWKLDVSKSDFGQMPPPDSETQTITHNDPDLKVNVVSTGGPMGDLNFNLNYTTDGKECVNKMGDNEFKSTLGWDGDDLVIDTKGSFGGNDFTSKDRWNLSNGGKTLNITRHFSSAMGEGDVKEVFEKQ